MGGPHPLGGVDRTDTSVGGLSIGGEAAREAIGVDPATAGGEVDDRNTGTARRDEVVGDGGS
jgi:hypothetical protein